MWRGAAPEGVVSDAGERAAGGEGHGGHGGALERPVVYGGVLCANHDVPADGQQRVGQSRRQNLAMGGRVTVPTSIGTIMLSHSYDRTYL